jgi:hypothetical protein
MFCLIIAMVFLRSTTTISLLHSEQFALFAAAARHNIPSSQAAARDGPRQL